MEKLKGYRMVKKLVMGNEAVGLGAILAGVHLASGYPGTPSTEIIETIAGNNNGDLHVEWSVNEKVALEVAAGASYAGARVIVTMKQVGLNVASDPLLSLTYVGINGGMVIAVADDPGPISSQTEQDTRHFCKFANLPVLDPATPLEAFQMVQYGFHLSEDIKLPVILRLSTRVCHSCATLDLPENTGSAREKIDPPGFCKNPDWVIFPALSRRKHYYLEEVQTKLAKDFSSSPFNQITGNGLIGVAAGGNAYLYVMEALQDLNLQARVLKIGTPYPFPQELAAKFMAGLDKILAVEELDDVIEEALLLTAARTGNSSSGSGIPLVFGKRTGHTPKVGEFTYEIVREALLQFSGRLNAGKLENKLQAGSVREETLVDPSGVREKPSLPLRPPVLCAGCGHRAAFYAVKQAVRHYDAVFTGDIGCYTLGNARPLEMVDTCLCMGAGLTVAQGLFHMEPGRKHLAFIGDSTFFHTGIPGVINAVYNQADISIMVLDNGTTAMTGHQPHPGTGKNLMNSISEKVDIYGLLKACGLKKVEIVDPLALKDSQQKIREVVDYPGPSALIFRYPCIALTKKQKTLRVDPGMCTGCRKCLQEIGCPAILPQDKIVAIDSALCTGCTLCAQICPGGAIRESEL